MNKFILTLVLMLFACTGYNVAAKADVVRAKADPKMPIVFTYAGNPSNDFTPIVFLQPDVIRVPEQGISFRIVDAKVSTIAKEGQIQFYPKARSYISRSNLS